MLVGHERRQCAAGASAAVGQTPVLCRPTVLDVFAVWVAQLFAPSCVTISVTGFKSRQLAANAAAHKKLIATPNIESVRLLLADAANQCIGESAKEEEAMLMIIDISFAYFYAPAQREIFITLDKIFVRADGQGICRSMDTYGSCVLVILLTLP